MEEVRADHSCTGDWGLWREAKRILCTRKDWSRFVKFVRGVRVILARGVEYIRRTTVEEHNALAR